MEFQKIVNLLNTTSHDEDLPRFVTKKMDWNLRSIRKKLPDLCDYSDAYIAVKGTIAVTDADNANRNKSVAFKNNAPCINCISKINGAQIGNEEDIDVVMPMYNLLEYSKNYRKKKQAVCGIITEKNQVIIFLLILNFLNARQVLQEILIILVLVMLGVM